MCGDRVLGRRQWTGQKVPPPTPRLQDPRRLQGVDRASHVFHSGQTHGASSSPHWPSPRPLLSSGGDSRCPSPRSGPSPRAWASRYASARRCRARPIVGFSNDFAKMRFRRADDPLAQKCQPMDVRSEPSQRDQLTKRRWGSPSDRSASCSDEAPWCFLRGIVSMMSLRERRVVRGKWSVRTPWSRELAELVGHRRRYRRCVSVECRAFTPSYCTPRSRRIAKTIESRRSDTMLKSGD